MAELARTTPAERLLFQTVDLAPLPQHGVISQALDAWRRLRGDKLAPRAAEMVRGQTQAVADHCFLAEPASAGDDDLALRRIGAAAALAVGSKADGNRLVQLTDRRIAVRLRHLFRLALDRDEAVDVRFADRGRTFEILAAPVRADGGRVGLFCAITSDRGPRPPAGSS